MKRVEITAGRLDQRCPACGGAFVAGAGTRKRKVHCPNCREIITIDPVQIPARAEEAPAVAELRQQAARVELLEARLERLERQLAAGSERPAGPALPAAQGEPSHFHEEAARSPGAEAILHDLRRATTEVFRIKVPRRNPAARQLADRLAEILITAGWTPPAITELASPPLCDGLTLRAASSLPSERLMMIFKALTALGFPVTLHLDPNPGTTETVLLIGHV